VGGEQDAAGLRELLHAGGEMRALAHGGVVHVQIVADRADDDLPRVEPDPDTRLASATPRHLAGVASDGLLHAERGIARAPRVVLVGEGRAEERHDAVAHHLVDGALVVMDGFHHPLQHGVEHRARVLGVMSGDQLERALDVGEEDRHLLALALHGRSRGQDAAGEVPRRVGVGRGERRGQRERQGAAAAVAEAAARRVSVMATRAVHAEAAPAGTAETGAGWVVLLAARTGHDAARFYIGRASRVTAAGAGAAAAVTSGPIQPPPRAL
jgi:hypothetical protein